jgi:uncharacterized SAM-binding protein YcdF (DUF218 family)
MALATGGVPPGAQCARPEAEVIAEALREAGIAAERILLEPSARNTWENAARTLRMLRGASPGVRPDADELPPLWLVTDPWHLPRAQLAFRAQGARACSAGCRAARGPGRLRLLRALVHEVFGYAAYLLRWLWQLAGKRPGAGPF